MNEAEKTAFWRVANSVLIVVAAISAVYYGPISHDYAHATFHLVLVGLLQRNLDRSAAANA